MAIACCRAIINIVLGAVCLLGFIIFRACHVPFYQSRLVRPCCPILGRRNVLLHACKPLPVVVGPKAII